MTEDTKWLLEVLDAFMDDLMKRRAELERKRKASEARVKGALLCHYYLSDVKP